MSNYDIYIYIYRERESKRSRHEAKEERLTGLKKEGKSTDSGEEEYLIYLFIIYIYYNKE